MMSTPPLSSATMRLPPWQRTAPAAVPNRTVSPGSIGCPLAAVMGGETAAGGKETVVVMQKPAATRSKFEYRLLATNKTSTMQKEMQEAGDAGYEFKGQTIFNSTFGGKEVVVVLERDKSVAQPVKYEYRLLATKKTSTLQKEVSEATAAGYAFVGMTVADTAIGGDEIVSILRKRIQ